jgi:putative transposase
VIVRKHQKSCPVSYLCKIAQVSRSGFYAWLKATASRRQREENDRSDYKIIEEIFRKSNKKSGWRTIKMHAENNYGVVMNHKKILRIMRTFHLVTTVRRANPYRKLAKATQVHKTLPNLLERNFDQQEPQKVFLTDITYLYYVDGRKAYLSVIKDGSTREILAHYLSTSLEMDIVIKTLDRLQETLGGNIHPEAIIHSDQGFHYTHPDFQQRLKELSITQSMSRKGNCLDNASMESFFGHMKDEIHIKECQSFTELQYTLDEYIEYYNCYRYQWGLKKMTPNQYRGHLIAA